MNSETTNLYTNYFNEIMKPEYDPLTNEEIVKLVKIAQSGYNPSTEEWETKESEIAKEKIIKANIRLIPYLVHKFLVGNHHLFMDCVNECHFAILKCIIGFKHDAETNFATYAQSAIRRWVWRFVKDNSTSVKLPSGELKKRQEQQRTLLSSNCFDTSSRIDLKPVNHVCSLDFYLDDGDKTNKNSFIDLISYDNNSNLLFGKEMKVIALESLKCLKSKEKTIIKKRYLEDSKKTLKDISEDIGMTGERVRQIEKNALRKMRLYIDYLEKNGTKAKK